jgi:hypothetical protein
LRNIIEGFLDIPTLEEFVANRNFHQELPFFFPINVVYLRVGLMPVGAASSREKKSFGLVNRFIAAGSRSHEKLMPYCLYCPQPNIRRLETEFR